MRRFSRRDFLGSAAGIGAAAAGVGLTGSRRAEARIGSIAEYRKLVPELFEPIPLPPPHSRAVVIGSGFGGAVSALRLAEAGIETTVLERGQRWPNGRWRNIFTYEPSPDGRGFWQRRFVSLPIVGSSGVRSRVDRFDGVLDITEYPNIQVWRGACVGGGSVVFTGVMIQPPQEFFRMIFGDTVSFEEMNRIYYTRVRTKLDLSIMPDEIYNSGPFGHSRVWDQQVESAGYVSKRVDSIFNWAVVQEELDLRSRPSATIGMSNLGNSNGAKFDLNQNYLKEAEQTGYATIYPDQQVTDIERFGRYYRIWIDKLNPSGHVIDSYSITCDYLFLGAGSIGTSELLVKAKAKDTIPGLNEEIGQGWGTNGDTLVGRSFNPIEGLVQGSPCASLIRDVDGPVPTSFENWYAAGVPIDVGILGALGIGFDLTNRGSFVYEPTLDEVRLRWPRDGNDAVVEAATRMNDRIAREGRPRSVPGVPPFLVPVWGGVTAHPLGGAVIGKATDDHGRVKNQRRLYVMDGAVIPGTTGSVNPSLTIAALAERNIERILAEDF
ncbi:MAG: GMC oxidoreductase [Pseudomonadota bacterium]